MKQYALEFGKYGIRFNGINAEKRRVANPIFDKTSSKIGYPTSLTLSLLMVSKGILFLKFLLNSDR